MARERGFGPMGRRSIMLGVSLLCLGTAGAVAQEGGAVGDPTRSARPIPLQPIVVVGAAPPATGTIGQPPLSFGGGQAATQARLGMFGNRDVLRAPFRLTGYTGKTIRDQQARSLADVTLNEPSVRQDAPAFSERDSFFIRGFSVTNLDTLYDGLPYIANARKSHLEGIEQVDILLGPSALAMGGTGRVGGTINLIPKRAGDEPLTRLTTSWLSDSQIWTHLDMGRRYGASGEWGVRGNLSYRNGDTALKHNCNEIGVATLGLDYRGERFRATLDLNHTAQNINAPTSLFNKVGPGDFPEAPDGDINTSNPFEFHDSSYDMVAGRLEYDIQPNTTLYAAAGASRYREDFLSSNYEPDGTGGLSNYLSVNPQEIEGMSGEVGIRSEFRTGSVGHRVNLSLSRAENKNNRGEFNPRLLGLPSYPIDIYDPVYLPGAPDLSGVPRAKDTIPFADILTTSIAFADTMSFMGDRVEVTVGGRHQKIRSRGFNTRPGIEGAPVGERNYFYEKSVFTPAIAASARVTDDLSVYANYVEALEEGEIAPATANNGDTISDPYVSKQKEVGLKYDLGTAVVSASLFEIRQENGYTNSANIFSTDGLQVNRGLELSVLGEPISGLRVLGGVTFLDAELRHTEGGTFDGKDVPGVPKTAISLYGEYDTPWIEDFTLTGRVLYGGSTYFDQENAQKVADWTRLDLGARYVVERSNGRAVEFRANIQNVLDENYWASSARGFLATGAPRTFALSASMTF